MRDTPKFAGLVPQPTEARSCRCSHSPIFVR
jgi:hypothetical protein